MNRISWLIEEITELMQDFCVVQIKNYYLMPEI